MGIASSVTTAALAALAAVGVIVTFVAGKYHELGAFYALIGISATLFVFAIVVGAQGTAEVTKEGYKGSWSPFTKKKLFTGGRTSRWPPSHSSSWRSSLVCCHRRSPRKPRRVLQHEAKSWRCENASRGTKRY